MLRAILAGGLLILLAIVLTSQFQGDGQSNVQESSTPMLQQILPQPYYISVPQRYGLSALKEYLDSWEWGREYEADVFDCTEMSAFLEMDLENEGFHTYIVGGYLGDEPHAWVKVEIAPNKYVIVASTILTVITPDNREYVKYHQEDQFETIYDAWKVSHTAWDWWNVK